MLAMLVFLERILMFNHFIPGLVFWDVVVASMIVLWLFFGSWEKNK